MTPASEIRAGNVVRLDGELCKVVEADFHQGAGKAAAMVHLKLRSLANGHVSEKRLAPDAKIDDISVDRVKMQYLFHEADSFTFMNPQSFDQIAIPRQTIGPAAAYLKENDEIEVEFFEEKPLAVLFPPHVELAVKTTLPGLHGDSTFKEAELENGVKVLVPQFIKEGDQVRVDTETGKYLDRVMDREVKGAKFTVAAPKQKPADPAKPKDEPKIPEG